jgi:tetratricopeptide (TPR) repeat protein
LAAVAIIGGFSFYATRLGGPEAVFEKAARFHEDRDYLQAILLYQELRGREEVEDPAYQARLAFLIGGAYESLWREVPSETSFAEALRSYEEAVGLDRGEMRVYAVDSLLAKAELLINRSQKAEQPDPLLEEQAWACLAKLIQEPEYRLNPAVHRGVPHRMLAERTEKEDPETAIQLLREARDAQGELEEGVENLRIAQIHLNLLRQPDQAMEYFELVRQNELANEEIRKSAEEALKKLRSADLRSSPLYGQEVEEILPVVEEEEL